MQNSNNKQMISKMKMSCCNEEKQKKGCDKSCCIVTHLDSKIIISKSQENFSKKVFKIKFFSFVDILDISSNFLENKNLIKNTSPPPNLNKKIKFYSYSDLIKIIKSNT